MRGKESVFVATSIDKWGTIVRGATRKRNAPFSGFFLYCEGHLQQADDKRKKWVQDFDIRPCHMEKKNIVGKKQSFHKKTKDVEAIVADLIPAAVSSHYEPFKALQTLFYYFHKECKKVECKKSTYVCILKSRVSQLSLNGFQNPQSCGFPSPSWILAGIQIEYNMYYNSISRVE